MRREVLVVLERSLNKKLSVKELSVVLGKSERSVVMSVNSLVKDGFVKHERVRTGAHWRTVCWVEHKRMV
jgi:predicted transcriptional regulator